MKEKDFSRIQTPEEKRETAMRALFGFLGIRDSLEDQEKVTESIKILREEIEKAPKVGRVLEKNKVGKKEFVIPVTSKEQEEKILECLYDLSIFPWKENDLLILEKKQDLEKLQLAGLIQDDTSYQEESKSQDISVGPDIEEKRFQFTLPKSAPLERRRLEKKKEKVMTTSSREEVSAIDEELVEIIQRFDEGLVDEEDPEFKKSFGEMPTLTLFPRKYIHKNGKIIQVHTGEVITPEKETAMLERAKIGDMRALSEYVRLHIGFVIYLAKRVRERLGGDIDEIFQDGLIGLEYAIRNYSAQEDVKFTSYAGKCIEGYMRRGLRQGRNDVILPVNSDRREAYRLRNQEEKKRQLLGPYYNESAEGREYSEGIQRLEQRLLIGAKFDPIEDHFDDREVGKIDAFGRDLYQAPDQENFSEHSNMKRKIFELLDQFGPRERFILAARFGLKEPFMLPEEVELYLKARGVLVNENGEVQNPIDLAPIDWFALYISNQLNTSPHIEHKESSIADGFTLEAVGDFLGISKARVRGIETVALRRLRHPSYGRSLLSFIDGAGYTSNLSFEEKNFSDSQERRENIEKIRSRLNFEKQLPPEGWQSLNTLAEETGIKRSRIENLIDIYSREHPDWIKTFTGKESGFRGPYAHPDFVERVKIIQNDISVSNLPPQEVKEIIEKRLEGKDWKSIKNLAEELGMDTVSLELAVMPYLQTNPEWILVNNSGQVNRVGSIHPELEVKIKEELSKG